MLFFCFSVPCESIRCQSMALRGSAVPSLVSSSAPLCDSIPFLCFSIPFPYITVPFLCSSLRRYSSAILFRAIPLLHPAFPHSALPQRFKTSLYLCYVTLDLSILQPFSSPPFLCTTVPIHCLSIPFLRRSFPRGAFPLLFKTSLRIASPQLFYPLINLTIPAIIKMNTKISIPIKRKGQMHVSTISPMNSRNIISNVNNIITLLLSIRFWKRHPGEYASSFIHPNMFPFVKIDPS